MSVAEGVSTSIRYKPYATGVITSNAQPVSATDPAATGGFTLRRVSSSLKLAKDTYQSAEVRTDRQIADYRHGVKRVTGSISGELSPATYFDFMEAALRTTKTSALTKSNVEFTSAAANSGASTFTFAAGDASAQGLRVGDIIRFTNLSEVLNNNKNFLIISMTALVLTVFPAPVTMAADTTFNLTTNGAAGKALLAPNSAFVSRKFAIEQFSSDIDHSLFFTECRVGGFNMQLPATGMGTIDVPMMGRDMETYSAGTAPFFTAPAAEGTTGIIAAVNGLVRVGGVTVGVVTGANVQLDLAPSSPAVVGQNFVPEIFLGRANVTGQLTALFEDLTLINSFKNESEIALLLYLTTSTLDATPAISVYLPRIKLGDAPVDVSGEAEQTITLPFQGLKSAGGIGEDATTIRIVDTQAV